MRSALRNNLLAFVLIFWCAALAVQLPGILGRSSQDNGKNVFNEYEAYMPGAHIDLARQCEIHDIVASSPDLEYATCYPVWDSHSPFRAITIQGRYGFITRSVFYVREGSIRLPEMMLWFGPISSIKHSASATYISWLNNIIVHINQWHGMMSYVSFIDVRNKIDGTP